MSLWRLVIERRWRFVREGAVLTAIGITAGMAGALTAIAVMATCLPARRAARVDPGDALRAG